jgi:septum formation inhibitor-activating ATPase MinD
VSRQICSGLNAQISESVPNISAQNSAHVTRLVLGSWSSTVLTAGHQGARIVARKKSGCTEALDFVSRRLCGNNTAVRMTSSTVFEWSMLVQAAKEMDYSTLHSCLPSRDEG